MKKQIKTDLTRIRSIKRGARVRILRTDIWEFRNWKKKRPRGVITLVNGGYIYVRPNGKWPRETKADQFILELYTNEIEVIS